MALPVVLIGAAVASALFGAKKGSDAIRDNRRARGMIEDAQSIFAEAEKKLISARRSTTRALEELGKEKLLIWNEQLGRFVQLFESLRNVELSGEVTKEQFDPSNFSPAELAEIKDLSLKASEVVIGGFASLGSGALVGVASYGGAMMFAKASTGTAIATLSGAAAKSATLAWFGGGSLAVGGMGVAGGTAVLGGLVAGPVLAVGGLVMAAKARQNLANARSNLAQAEKAVEEMKIAATAVRVIGRLSREYLRALRELKVRMDIVLKDLERVVQNSGTDYAEFDEFGRHTVYTAVQFAQVVKLLLEEPLLTEDGAPNREARTTLREMQRALPQPA